MGSHSVTFEAGTFRGWEINIVSLPDVDRQPPDRYTVTATAPHQPGAPLQPVEMRLAVHAGQPGHAQLRAGYLGGPAELESAMDWLFAWAADLVRDTDQDRNGMLDGVLRRPLLITADPALRSHLQRLAEIAGVELSVVADPAAARCRYDRASLVLVGGDRAAACARSMPKRRNVVMVGAGQVDWSRAELLGVEHVAVLPVAAPWLTDRLWMTQRRTAVASPRS